MRGMQPNAAQPKMKLRQLPEDFKVEEINEFKVSTEMQGYKLYLLEKRSAETFSLLQYLSAKNRIPVPEFGIAGLKDRHAVTKQYFTIPSRYNLITLHEQNFDITFLGYVREKISLGDLACNRFEITVRDIKKGELDGVYQKAATLPSIGVPNYFDSQRFGSVIDKQFIAKKIIRGDYEGAVKIFLTSFSKHESSRIKQEKKHILANWGKISSLNLIAQQLAGVVAAYKKRRSWLDAYKAIPASIRQMIISAYQSYLWNECVKLLLIRTVDKKKIYSIKYNVGSLAFYKKLADEELKKIPKTFKTISDEIKPAGIEGQIISKVLEKENISIREFNIKQQTGNFFKMHERDIIIRPLDFKISRHEVDEQNDVGKKNSFKIRLSFSLPKGSYATMVTKRLFNR